jgi:hypothetical protein
MAEVWREGEWCKEGIINEGSAGVFPLEDRRGRVFTGVVNCGLCRAFVGAILALVATGVASISPSSISLSLRRSDPNSDADCIDASSLDSYSASPQESPKLPRSL